MSIANVTLTPASSVIRSPLMLEGDNLENVSTIWFGQEKASYLYENGSIQVTVPPGSGNVSVNIYDNSENTTSINFQYLFPTIDTVMPYAGTKNQWIKITGENLSNTSYVNFVDTTNSDFEVFFTQQFQYANGSMRVKVPSRNDDRLITDYSVNITAYDIYENPTIYTGMVDLSRL